jgi:hypothetical protein
VTLWDGALAVQVIRAEVGEISNADKPVGGSIVLGPVVSVHETPVTIARRTNWTVLAAFRIRVSAMGACFVAVVSTGRRHVIVIPRT